jgi:ATP-binding cassette subfamily B protein
MSDPGERKVQNREITRRVAAFFGPHRKMIIFTMFAVLAGVVFGLLPPIFLKTLIDEGLTKKNLTVVTEFSILTIIATIFSTATGAF